MWNVLKKIFGWIRNLATRPGLDRFLADYINLAVSELEALRLVNSNAEFHVWKDQAFARLQQLTGQTRGTWVAILIHLAYDVLVNEKPRS